MQIQSRSLKLYRLRGIACATLFTLGALALSGCGGGGGGDGSSASANASAPANTSPTPSPSTPSPAPAPQPVPAPAPEPVPGTGSNHAPIISGSAINAVNAGNSYAFAPSASDSDGDALTFSIHNKPAWASFNASTGQLTGTPSAADVGTYSNISISVTDGAATGVVGPFSIAVTASASGSATLSWIAPTTNTDGSALTNLAGYKIYYGTSPTALTKTISINTSGITTYVVEDLSPSTWYFSVSAVASSGAESSNSTVASKKI